MSDPGAGRRIPLLDLMAGLAIGVIWGLTQIAAREGIDHLGPLTFMTLRMALVALILVPFVPRPQPGRWRTLFLLMLSFGLGHFLFLFLSLSLATNLGALAVMALLWAPFATILAAIFLRDRMGWRRASGLALAFTGCLIMGFDPAIFQQVPATLLTIVAAFSFGVYSIQLRQLPAMPATTMLGWMGLICTPVYLALALIFEPDGLPNILATAWRGWAAVAYLVICVTLGAHGMYAWLLSRHPVSRVAPIGLLPPVVALFSCAWYYDEPLTPKVLVGSALTLLGIAAILVRRPQLSERPPS